jgi:hypothetical protein
MYDSLSKPYPLVNAKLHKDNSGSSTKGLNEVVIVHSITVCASIQEKKTDDIKIGVVSVTGFSTLMACSLKSRKKWASFNLIIEA